VWTKYSSAQRNAVVNEFEYWHSGKSRKTGQPFERQLTFSALPAGFGFLRFPLAPV
jgi:hypothetical protein